MVTMFIDTLPSPFYDKAVVSVASSFVDLGMVGDRIDDGIDFVKKPSQEKKKGEASAILLELALPYGKGKPPPPYPTQISLNKAQSKADTRTTASSRNARFAQQNAPGKTLSLIPMTYMELFPFLLQNNLIVVVPLRPVEPPYPKSCDPNMMCDYHGGIIRHPTEKCWSLRHKVQDLIDGGWLRFREREPNINSSPFPEHGGLFIDTIFHESQK
ncbi:hypothetical protein CR513_47029, partial [Mucuna pruriens]